MQPNPVWTYPAIESNQPVVSLTLPDLIKGTECTVRLDLSKLGFFFFRSRSGLAVLMQLRDRITADDEYEPLS